MKFWNNNYPVGYGNKDSNEFYFSCNSTDNINNNNNNDANADADDDDGV